LGDSFSASRCSYVRVDQVFSTLMCVVCDSWE